MNEEEIKKIIFQELKKIAPETAPEKLLPDNNIRQTLDIDSFDSLQFIVSLDEKLGVNIPEADYGKVNTLKELVAYIITKQNVSK
jgi:acyl carrier protein